MPCFEKHVFGGLLNFLADFIAVMPTHPGTKSSLPLDSFSLFSHLFLFSLLPTLSPALTQFFHLVPLMHNLKSVGSLA